MTTRHTDSFVSGMVQAIPIMLVYIAYAVPFGMLAVQMGIPGWAAIALSAFGFAGSAQFLALHLFGMGAGVAAILTAAWIINLRHVFYSMALALRLPPMSAWQRVYIAHTNTDESFGINMAKSPTTSPLSLASVLGTNLLAHGTWTGATAVGVVLGHSLTTESLPYLDLFKALLPMMFAVLLALRLRTRRDALVALCAVPLTLGAIHLLPGHGAFLVGAVAAPTLVQLLRRRQQDEAICTT